MRMLTLLGTVMLFAALTGCEALAPYFSDTKNQLEAIAAITAAGVYTATYTVSKDGQPYLTQTVVYECTQENGKLTGCHKR